MGNNTSSLPMRRPSLSRDHSKPSHTHQEYPNTNANANTGNNGGGGGGLPPVQLKSKPTIDIERSHHNATYKDDGTTLVHEDKIQSSNHVKEPPRKKNNNSERPKVSTPIILEDLVDMDNDYFGKVTYNDVTDQFDEDDDGYGIDEDLATPTTGTDESKTKVLLKFSDDGVLDLQDHVYVIGSFDHWSRKTQLDPDYDSEGRLMFKTILALPRGIYRVKFLVNNEFRHTNELPTATDKSGNFVNWFEVGGSGSLSEIKHRDGVVYAGEIEKNKISHNMKKSSHSFLHQSESSITQQYQSQRTTTPDSTSRLKQYNESANSLNNFLQNQNKLEYNQEIPQAFQTFNDESDELLPVDEVFLKNHPIPELPVYLNNNYLNKHFNIHHSQSSDTATLNKQNSNIRGLNSHIIPHVNLNHLLTSNIKNGVLGVACTTRYSGKFVTQIMYSPSEDLEG